MVVCGELLLVQGLIYGILMAEDYALLMGAMLLFAALASVMLVTRKLIGTALLRGVKRPESLLKERGMQ